MPLPKPPFVASAEQVRISRKGDAAIIEYADDTVATTHLTIGAEKLAKMTDAQVPELWNSGIEGTQQHRRTFNYVATEVPVGKPPVEFFAPGGQWTLVATSCAAKSSRMSRSRLTSMRSSCRSTAGTSRWLSS